MMRWLVELQEFDFSFLVEATSRATLADLLTYKDGPILVKEVEEKLTKEKQVTIPGASTLFFDGSYKRSMHQSTCGFLILNAAREEVMRKGVRVEASTNNEAEYEAYTLGMEALIALGVTEVEIFGDSMLVINQAMEEWELKEQHLRPYLSHL